MSTNMTTERADSARINDLYWNSARTIEDIVAELGVSRHALYASVEPIPAGADCFACGSSLVFSNRSSRASGTANCEACGLDTELNLEELQPRSGSSSASTRSDRWRSELSEVEPRRMALVGGAAALGIMAGAAVVRTLRS